ncbi:MAG: hypothetical protein WA919_12405 [Coleofasciculaceae cyanobacterium]
MRQSSNNQLTKEVIKPVKRRDILISILGTFILVLLINFAAGWYLQKNTPNRGYFLINQKWEMLLGLKQPVNWLILGDSSCNQGIIPSVLNEKLNVTSLNLCTIGDMLALNDAWMLDKYIKKLGVPQNILLVHVYDVWHRSANPRLLGKIPLNLPNLQKLQPQISLSFKQLIQFFWWRYFPLNSESSSLANLLKHPIESYEQAKSFKLEENGFMIWEKADPYGVEVDTKRHIKFTKDNRFKLSSPNHQALEKIAALAQHYNFNVYLANSPIHQKLSENEEFQAYYAQVKATLSTYAAQSEQIHYISEPVTFSKYQMQNSDHLIYTSAKVYTQTVISQIFSASQSNTVSQK